MIPSWARLAAGVPITAAGVALLLTGVPDVGAVTTALGVLLLLGWFRYGDVRRAAEAFNHQDREKAWEILAKVPADGRFLARPIRIYRHQVRASCLLKWERWAEAAAESEAVLRLRADPSQRAASHAAASQAYAEIGDLAAARRHYDAARALPPRDVLERRLARAAELLAAAGARAV